MTTSDSEQRGLDGKRSALLATVESASFYSIAEKGLVGIAGGGERRAWEERLKIGLFEGVD